MIRLSLSMVPSTPAVDIDCVRHSVKRTIKFLCIILTSTKRSVESQVAHHKSHGSLCGIIMIMSQIKNHFDQGNAILNLIHSLILAIKFEPLSQILMTMLK